MSGFESDDSAQQIKARLNLLEVVQRRVPLRRRGREWWGLCPFHQEKTPSFKVNQFRQQWYCFGCQRGGDLFDFIESVEKVDFRGALELLAEMAGIQLHQPSPAEKRKADLKKNLLSLNELAVQYYEYVLHSLPAGAPGRELLATREVDDATSRRFRLGYAPQGDSLASFLRQRGHSIPVAIAAGLVRRDGQDYFQQRLLIPIRDERGRTVAFTGRTTQPEEPRKYVNSMETPLYKKGQVLFGLDLARSAIEEQGRAVIMEGQFDVIVATSKGVKNAVASSGTAFTPSQLELLQRFTEEIVLAFDNDQAGTTATHRSIELAADKQLSTRVIRIPPPAKDPDEFLRAGGNWEELQAAALPGWEAWLRDVVEGLKPHRPEDVEIGRRRLSTVLQKIKDPALWTLYEGLAKQLLEINPRLNVFGSPPTSPNRVTSLDKSESLANKMADKNISNSMAYLLQALVVHPEALERVREVLVPEDLVAEDRAAYLRLIKALEMITPENRHLDLSEFPSTEQELLRQAQLAPPPGIDSVVVEDVARKLGQQSRSARRRAIISDLAEAEQRGETARLIQLQEEFSRLQRGGVS